MQGIKNRKFALQMHERSNTQYYQCIDVFFIGLYQHPSLYRGIVKVTWRVFNQLNVCFIF